MKPDICFPHLGITIESLGKSINIGGFSIAYYGIVIALGMVMGYLMAAWQAKRTNQSVETYLDLTLWAVVFSIIGARIYYVVFSWDYYGQHPEQIFNLRGGGIAIYGGIIGGVITTYVFSRKRGLSFLRLADTACAGLLVGQIIGRWGNFFNREVFGGYTDSLFAMQIKKSDVRDADCTADILNNLVNINGEIYIQVHPTFLYESLWNVAVLLIILIFTKKKKYDGQLFLIYLLGYGSGRFWIEGVRTDQLKIGNTGIAVSQVLSGIICVLSLVVLIVMEVLRRKKSRKAD